jgi:hypothetical protein
VIGIIAIAAGVLYRRRRGGRVVMSNYVDIDNDGIGEESI